MIEPDGSLGNLYVAVAGALLSMVIAFIATMILYKEKKEEKPETAGPEGEERGKAGNCRARRNQPDCSGEDHRREESRLYSESVPDRKSIKGKSPASGADER